jgi:hypothetical protein
VLIFVYFGALLVAEMDVIYSDTTIVCVASFNYVAVVDIGDKWVCVSAAGNVDEETETWIGWNGTP